jgi:hypothetical protein
VVAVALALGVSLAIAGPPRAGCRVTFSENRALVDIELTDFFDPELLKLVRLGLEGKIQLELSVVRPRAAWFDEKVGEERTELAVRYDKPRRKYRLDHRRDLNDPNRFWVERLAVRLGNGERAVEYRVELRAALEVVTPKSLNQVADWIAIGRKPGGGSVLSRTLVDRITGDLQRKVEAQCEPVNAPPPR